jgi:hypothetical protein
MLRFGEKTNLKRSYKKEELEVVATTKTRTKLKVVVTWNNMGNEEHMDA